MAQVEGIFFHAAITASPRLIDNTAALLPVVNFRVNLVMKSASSFSKTKGEAISKSFFMPITARYGVDKTEKRQPRRKAKHLRLHNVCPLLRHPQNDADLEPHPHSQ